MGRNVNPGLTEPINFPAGEVFESARGHQRNIESGTAVNCGAGVFWSKGPAF